MQHILKFEIELPLLTNDTIERIEDKSVYDCNYYLLREYGDWVSFYGNCILEERYDEEYNTYTYTFGKFDSNNDKFCAMFGYTTDKNEIKFASLKIKNIKYEDIVF